MQLVVKIVPSGSCLEKHGNPQRQLNPKDVSIKKNGWLCSLFSPFGSLDIPDLWQKNRSPVCEQVNKATRWSGQLTRRKSMGILKMTPSGSTMDHRLRLQPLNLPPFIFHNRCAACASWGRQHLEAKNKSSDFQVLFVATYLIWCPSTPSAKIVSLPTTALDGPREWNGKKHNWGHGAMVKILTKIQMTAGDKLGKLLRFVMQINSCIDCYFETQTFHPDLSYNPKSGWVGLFQPHVNMSKLKDLSVISRTNFYIFASC